jgi:hypothetical protein
MHNRPFKDSTVLSAEYLAESFDQIAVMLAACCRIDSVAVASATAVSAVMLEISGAALQRRGLKRLLTTAQRLIRACEVEVTKLPADRRVDIDRAMDRAIDKFDQFAGWASRR